tara:strand:+ start:11361 stop:13793 length:2433 start_codon:yes stop_codon:yes gene_type:complete
MSSTKTLSVFLKLNSKEFTSGLKKIEGKLNKFGSKLGKIGSSLSTNVSMPLIGLGAVAVKTASEFESSMTKIQTLVGLPKDAVDKLSESVLNLSGDVATGPKELADGLYFLTSAGLDAESAMKALEATAKGSAAGLGDMESLAVVAAAAQNAYGEEVLTSSDALDIFGSMVQSGMFKSEELANVLGSQLGLASNLGISMEEVGAMISTYTRTTGSATDATTGLSGVMMSFAKITPKAEKALAKATESMEGGAMSADDLRNFLGENGLQNTLLMLQEQFSSAGIPLSEFFSKSQALKGVLGIVGEQSENYIDILNNMESAQGFVNDAFDETSQTSAFKFKQAIADLQVAGVKLGESLMPVATGIANTFSKMANKFSSLSEESRAKIVKFGLALVALGPTLIIIGKMVKMFQFVVKVVRIARTAIIAVGAAARAMNPIGMVITAIIGIVGLLIKNWDWTKQKIVDVVNGFIDLYNESMGFKIAVEGIKFAFKAVWNYIEYFFKQVKTIFSALGNAIVDLINFRNPVSRFKDAISDMKDNASDFVEKTAEDFDTMMDNINSKEKIEFITTDDIDNKIGDMKGKLEGFVSDMSGALGLGDLLGGGEEGEDVENLEIDATANITDITYGDGEEDGENPEIEVNAKLNKDELDKELQELEQSFGSAFEQMADLQDKEGISMVDNIKKQTREAIKARLAEGVSAFMAKALAGVPFPANAIVAATAGSVVGSLFNSVIPPFAEGGLVSGKTLAMVGEGAGTSIVNPEVIAPLDKLKGMLGDVGGGGRLHGTIQGADILLTNSRSTLSQNRVGGSVADF